MLRAHFQLAELLYVPIAQQDYFQTEELGYVHNVQLGFIQPVVVQEPVLLAQLESTH